MSLLLPSTLFVRIYRYIWLPFSSFIFSFFTRRIFFRIFLLPLSLCKTVYTHKLLYIMCSGNEIYEIFHILFAARILIHILILWEDFPSGLGKLLYELLNSTQLTHSLIKVKPFYWKRLVPEHAKVTLHAFLLLIH